MNHPEDTKQLAEANEVAYKEGFYRGKMILGAFKWSPVQEAKELGKKSLIESGDAFNYAEPDGLVISRSVDEFVAAHLDQWRLNYGKAENGGDDQRYSQVLKHVNGGLNTFSSEAENQFEKMLEWLSQWPCARSYSLGSKLP